MHECGAFTISKQIEKKLEATENVVPTENATNLMECKEIERKSVTNHNKFTYKIRKCQATFFGHVMRKQKIEHLVTTEMIEEKCSNKILTKYVGWTNKVDNCSTSDR